MIKLLFRKIKHNTSLILVLLLLLFSCQNISSEDIYGKYSPISYKNSFDTLTINKDGIYNRRVYDKKKKRLLNYNSKYKLEGNTINFDDFYLNLDKDLVTFPEDINDVDMTYTTFFEKKDKNITLCFGYHSGENCYKKVSNKKD